jgi:hypothetical protein
MTSSTDTTNTYQRTKTLRALHEVVLKGLGAFGTARERWRERLVIECFRGEMLAHTDSIKDDVVRSAMVNMLNATVPPNFTLDDIRPLAMNLDLGDADLRRVILSAAEALK